MHGPYLRKYGEAATVDFVLYDEDGVHQVTGAVHASGDTRLMKDEGDEANTANGFVDEGRGYSITLTASEMQAARVVVHVVDQSDPKAWLDTSIVVESYGHANAQHGFDLDTGTQTVDLSAAAVASVIAGDAQLLVDTTVQSVVDQTHLRLADGPAGDDELNGQTVVVYDGSSGDDPSVRRVVDYVAANKEITLDSAAAFVVAPGDGVRVLVAGPGSSAPTASEVAEAVLDESVADHQTAGSVGAELHLAKAMLGNRRLHTISTGVDQVFDDDGVTLLRTMTPVDGGDDVVEVEAS